MALGECERECERDQPVALRSGDDDIDSVRASLSDNDDERVPALAV